MLYLESTYCCTWNSLSEVQEQTFKENINRKCSTKRKYVKNLCVIITNWSLLCHKGRLMNQVISLFQQSVKTFNFASVPSIIADHLSGRGSVSTCKGLRCVSTCNFLTPVRHPDQPSPGSLTIYLSDVLQAKYEISQKNISRREGTTLLKGHFFVNKHVYSYTAYRVGCSIDSY